MGTNDSYSLLIRLCDFENLPREPYLSYIRDNYGDDSFNIYDLIDYFDSSSHDLLWFMSYCSLLRTDEFISLYLSKHPSFTGLYHLMYFYDFARRDDVWLLYLSMDPPINTVLNLSFRCIFVRNKLFQILKEQDIDYHELGVISTDDLF